MAHLIENKNNKYRVWSTIVDGWLTPWEIFDEEIEDIPPEFDEVFWENFWGILA